MRCDGSNTAVDGGYLTPRFQPYITLPVQEETRSDVGSSTESYFMNRGFSDTETNVSTVLVHEDAAGDTLPVRLFQRPREPSTTLGTHPGSDSNNGPPKLQPRFKNLTTDSGDDDQLADSMFELA